MDKLTLSYYGDNLRFLFKVSIMKREVISL